MMGFGGFGFLGPLVMILFWGGIIALIVWAVAAAIPRREGAASREASALEILQNRYARGEITREEFEAIKKDLA